MHNYMQVTQDISKQTANIRAPKLRMFGFFIVRSDVSFQFRKAKKQLGSRNMKAIDMIMTIYIFGMCFVCSSCYVFYCNKGYL